MTAIHKASKDAGLDFIDNAELRKTLENSFYYIYLIFDQAKESKNALYQEETYRVIVLYSISIIEAILLYILKARNEQISYTEYSYVCPLTNKFINKEIPDSPVVVAVQRKRQKDDSQIGLVELVEFMINKTLMSADLAKEVITANEIRNTYHFMKSRSTITFNINKVEKTLETLVKIIDLAPRIINQKAIEVAN